MDHRKRKRYCSGTKRKKPIQTGREKVIHEPRVKKKKRKGRDLGGEGQGKHAT